MTTADVQDRDAAAGAVLPRASEDFPSLNKVWADARYQGPVVADAANEAGLELEIVRRSEEDRGFVVQKRRWVVVRTNAWLTRQRRLARDDERPERTEWMGKGGSGPHLRGPGRGHGTSRDPALPDARLLSPGVPRPYPVPQ
ncbi:transposase [Corallococcus exiguus]|uniref:transposase n=1 Tax=Corallococcus exiguus TaxID=83462 RepID=UPI001470A218|nr:transposase [Corallococcus exiguus]NNB87807.1 transposase [Corallococcus exiguus]NNB95001.1 transposase [Corallococcus exiguus]